MLLRSAGFVGIEMGSLSLVVVDVGVAGLPGPAVHLRATTPSKRTAATTPIHHRLAEAVEAGFCWDLGWDCFCLLVGFRFFLARLFSLDIATPF